MVATGGNPFFVRNFALSTNGNVRFSAFAFAFGWQCSLRLRLEKLRHLSKAKSKLLLCVRLAALFDLLIQRNNIPLLLKGSNIRRSADCRTLPCRDGTAVILHHGEHGVVLSYKLCVLSGLGVSKYPTDGLKGQKANSPGQRPGYRLGVLPTP